jgi:Zn-dependent protease with chaperone function
LHSDGATLRGGDGIRTHCLYIANVALYQLSYTPEEVSTLAQRFISTYGRGPVYVAGMLFVGQRRVKLSGLIPPMSLEHSCAVCGHSSDVTPCPTCGDVTQYPTDDESVVPTGASAQEPDPSGNESEEPVEVVYLTGSVNSELSRSKKYVQMTIRLWFVYAIPVLCAALAVVDRYRIVFIIGTVLGVQAAYLRTRSQRFQGPAIDDENVRSRISPPLKELCADAGCSVPRVCVRRSVYPAAMFRQKVHSTLWLSPDFLDVTDDGALRAIIAHEIVHLRRNDVAATKKLDGLIFFALYVVWIGLYLHFTNDRWFLAAAFFVFILPVARVMAFVTGFWRRDRETRADLEGAQMANDPRAMIRGLRDVHGLIPGIRRSIYGPDVVRWMLFPYGLRSTIHPPLEERITKLEAMAAGSVDIESVTKVLEKRDASHLRLMNVITFIAIAFALVLTFLHRSPETSPIPTQINVSSGAPFIPLSGMGVLPATYELSPLSPKEMTEVTETAAEALSTAESREDLQPGPGLYEQMSKGSFTDLTKNLKSEPAYVVVLSGPVLNNSFFYGGLSEIVVVVSAQYGTVIDSTDVNDS